MTKAKNTVFTALIVVSVTAVILGVFMMFMAAIKEFGWFALIGNIESVIAVRTLWTGYALYRIGLITEILGSITFLTTEAFKK